MQRKLTADNYLNILEFENFKTFGFNATNIQDLKVWQNSFRETFKELLGINNIQKSIISDIKPRVLERVDCGGYIKETVIINTEEGFELSFYLLIPENISSPVPAVITLYDETYNNKDFCLGIDQTQESEEIKRKGLDTALQAVNNDFVAIVPDMRGFDKDQDSITSCRIHQMIAVMFGRTIMGERVWDISKVLDYAFTRKEIDQKKTAVMGYSVGGAVAIYTAACDSRVSMCVVSNYFSLFKEIFSKGDCCVCEYIPGILNMADLPDIAGLIAPRSLQIIGKEEGCVKTSGSESIKQLKRIYQAANAQDKFQFLCRQQEHVYNCAVWDYLKNL